jgi:3-oxoacyl-[acyl-carrier protein] reductase
VSAPGRLDGRVALVTGGSRGIGAAVTEWLLANGAAVYALFKHNEHAAQSLKRRLGQDGERLHLIKADVTEDAALTDAFGHVSVEAGRLDILVHCAGAVTDGLLLRMSDDRVRAGLSLNLESAIACARESLPFMLKQRYGRIVHVSSVVAVLGNAGQTVYAAAKGGVEAFSRSLAREVGSRGITVNCVSPGLIETEMTDSLAGAIKARAIEATAVGRPGTPQEVASAVGFLCTEEAGYITGTVLHVNGGMYM